GQTQNYHQTDVFDTGLDSPLLALLNARYIVIPATTASDQLAPRFERVVQTVYADATVRVLANQAAFPRAWMIHSAEQMQHGHARLPRRATRPDVRRRPRAACGGGARRRAQPGAALRIRGADDWTGYLAHRCRNAAWAGYGHGSRRSPFAETLSARPPARDAR